MATTLTFPTLTPFTLFSIPAYYFITLSAHIYGMNYASSRIPSGRKALDVNNPRARNTDIYQKSLSPRDFATVQRASAAHANGNENFPLFVSAVLAGTIAGLSGQEVERFAIASVVGRVLYNLAYIGTEQKKYAPIRSVMWSVTTIWALTTLVRAGLNVMNNVVVV